MSADIAMMYRQILMAPEQHSLQRILWRSSTTDLIQTFEMQTITYGVASSSFLAIRCLFELAGEYENYYPKIAQIIRNSMYVDDLLCGAHSIQEAFQISCDIIRVLNAGGFELRKWITNHPDILRNISNSGDPHCILESSADQNIKTLGLSWS